MIADEREPATKASVTLNIVGLATGVPDIRVGVDEEDFVSTVDWGSDVMLAWEYVNRAFAILRRASRPSAKTWVQKMGSVAFYSDCESNDSTAFERTEA